MTKIFVSYSHKDKKFLEELKTTLSPIQSGFGFDLWDDTRIRPGEDWKLEISKALDSSKIAILIVSPDFLASKYIVNNELPPLLRKAAEGGLVVFWILLSDCLYQQTEIGKFQAAHDISKPLDQLNKGKKRTILVKICQQLLEIIKHPPLRLNEHKKDPNFTNVFVECEVCGGVIEMPVPTTSVKDSPLPVIPFTYVHGAPNDRHAILVYIDHDFQVRRTRFSHLI